MSFTPIPNPLPVSGPLTDTQLRAAVVPVSGAFYQATQPVSGTFFQATQPVSINGASFLNITGNAATTTVKSGAGKLRKLIFNNTSGTSFVIYDNTAASGTIIGTVTTAAGCIGSWVYDIAFTTGLTIITIGNGLDMTVVYE